MKYTYNIFYQFMHKIEWRHALKSDEKLISLAPLGNCNTLYIYLIIMTKITKSFPQTIKK